MIDIANKEARELRTIFTALEWDLYRRKGILPEGYVNSEPKKEPAKKHPKRVLNEAQKLFMSAVKARPTLHIDFAECPENLFCPYSPTGNPPIKLPYPDGIFRVIEIDPPWNYMDRNFNGFADVQAYRVHPNYDVMTMYDIWQMGHEIRRVANQHAGCHLYLWATKDFELQARAMMEAWGWLFKQSVPWIKTTEGLNRGHVGLGEFTDEELATALRVMASWGQYGKPAYGMGRWMRNLVEPLLVGTNDNSHKLANAANEPALLMELDQGAIFDPTTGHSVKPPSAYDLIRRNSRGPRLSLFARDKREGFLCWGNEVRP